MKILAYDTPTWFCGVLLNKQFQNKMKRSNLKELRYFADIFERNYFHPHKLLILKISLIALLLS